MIRSKTFLLLAFFSFTLILGAAAQSDQYSDDGTTHLAIPGRPSAPKKETPQESEKSDSQNDEEYVQEPRLSVYPEVWYKSNMCVLFDKYPYANKNYLSFDNSLADYPEDVVERKDKFWRFAVDTSCFYNPGFGAGNLTRLEGFAFKFVGPLVELYSYFPQSGNVLNEVNEYSGDIRLGVEVAIFQNNWFNCIFTCQWSHYFNLDIENGWLFGFIFRTYPYKVAPLIAEYRINMGAFDDYEPGYVMVESHLEIGAMLFHSAFEIYGAWNWQNKSLLNYQGHGFELGVRYHF